MTEPVAPAAAETRPPVEWGPPPAGTAASAKGSARTRSQWAIGLLALAGVLGLIAGVQDLIGLDVFKRAFDGTLSEADANAFDAAFSTVGVWQTIVLVATAIAFLAWLSRSVDNIERLTGEKGRFTPNWSIGWWFIPFANLVVPYQIVADLYRRMAPSRRVLTGIIGAWWVIWIVGNITSNIASRLYLIGDDLAELTLALQIYAISDFADPIAAVLIIVVIRRIQRWADGREPGPAAATTAPPEPMLAASPAEPKPTDQPAI
jgi:hypothetical protein